MNLESVKQVAIRAAYRAGGILNNFFGNLTQVTKKGAIDLVTEADIESEQAIVETIRATFPDHAILAEESGDLNGSGEGRWIVDPLDGTTNFAHNLGIYSVSIAFAHNDDIVVGIVYNPTNGELFTAVQGQGAWLNNHPIHVSATATVADSLLVTGFPYTVRSMSTDLMARFTRCLTVAQGIRRLGSAALDLCYVACGRFDGVWEENLKPWDTAAGMLIAREAGAQVTDFYSKPFHIDKKQILASNGHIHHELLTLLALEAPK